MTCIRGNASPLTQLWQTTSRPTPVWEPHGYEVETCGVRGSAHVAPGGREEGLGNPEGLARLILGDSPDFVIERGVPCAAQGRDHAQFLSELCQGPPMGVAEDKDSLSDSVKASELHSAG